MSKKLIFPIMGLALALSAVAVNAADEESTGEDSPSETSLSTQESTSPAQPVSDENPIAAMFKKLDANNDGIIDKKEAKTDKDLAKDFKKIAKKGKLDLDAYQKWEQARAAKQSSKAKS